MMFYVTSLQGGQRNLHAIYGGVEFGLDRFELAQRHAMQGQAGMQLGQSGDESRGGWETQSSNKANPMVQNWHITSLTKFCTFRRYVPHQLFVYIPVVTSCIQLCKPFGILFSAVYP